MDCHTGDCINNSNIKGHVNILNNIFKSSININLKVNTITFRSKAQKI